MKRQKKKFQVWALGFKNIRKYQRAIAISVSFLFFFLTMIGGCEGDRDRDAQECSEVGVQPESPPSQPFTPSTPPPSTPPTAPPTPIGNGVTTPFPLTPVDNAIIEQNNPNVGCPPHPTAGFGGEIFFDWTDATSPNGIAGYQIFVSNISAIFPILDEFVTESEITLKLCNSFVSDPNLLGWEWRVTARDNAGLLSHTSPTATFQFAPCRLDDGTPCNAPAVPQIARAKTCQSPLLTEDFGYETVIFIDPVSGIIAGLTGDGANLAISLTDGAASVSFSATTISDTSCELDYAQLDSDGDGELDLAAELASGNCGLKREQTVLEVRDVDAFDAVLPDFEGECYGVVELDGSTTVEEQLIESHPVIMKKMKTDAEDGPVIEFQDRIVEGLSVP